MTSDLSTLTDWTARLAEHKREAEEAVTKLVAFIKHLEGVLSEAKEALSGIASAVGVPPPEAASSSVTLGTFACVECHKQVPAKEITPHTGYRCGECRLRAAKPSPASAAKPPQGVVIPPALWARIEEIEAAGAGELLGPECEKLGFAAVEDGNSSFVDELAMRGWTLKDGADGMIYSRVAAEQIFANRKAAAAAREARKTT